MLDEVNVRLVSKTSVLREVAQFLRVQERVTISDLEEVRGIDPVTVLTITASAITIINGLLGLHDRFKKSITVRNTEGEEIMLDQCSRDSLQELIGK